MNKYLISLAYIEGLGPKTLEKLLLKFDSAEALWQASQAELTEVGLKPELALKIFLQKQTLNPDKIVEQLQKQFIQTLTIEDKNYPESLKEIYDPPLVLFYRGNLEILKKAHFLGVVGSRKISEYVKIILPKILEPVIRKEVVIVSGLAFGVDKLAHELTLNEKVATVAVLGSGLDKQSLYPASHLNLAKKIIAQNGLLLTEFPPGTPGLSFNFPRRNRIISALSQVILVAEAAEKSGALITADFALEQGKEILAIPQNINQPNSRGVNRLIIQGAKVVQSPDDILDNFDIIKSPLNLHKPNLSQLTNEQIQIYHLLNFSPVSIDKIIEKGNLDTSLILGALMELEIRGLIQNINNYYYCKK